MEFNQHNKQEYPPMHTAEHILNGTMVRMFGCGRSFSAHIERKKSKCDYRLATPLSESQLRGVEDAVNAVIGRGLPVTTEVVRQEDVADRFDLSRLPTMPRLWCALCMWATMMNACVWERTWKTHRRLGIFAYLRRVFQVGCSASFSASMSDLKTLLRKKRKNNHIFVKFF